MKYLIRFCVMITLFAGAALAQCGAGAVIPNPFSPIPRNLCTAPTPTGAASSGVLYWNGSTYASTATGGAGTLCLTSVSGAAPVWGSCSGSAATAWSSFTAPVGNLSLAMAANTTLLTWGNATGAATNLFSITDTANNTGTGFAFIVNLASGSAAKPAEFAVNGNGVSVSNAGVLAALGTGHVSADQLNGTAFSGTQDDVVAFGAANIPLDTGILRTNLVTAAANFTSGNLVQAAGNNKTTSDSGIAASAVVTLTGAQTLTNKTLTTPKVTTINDANGNPFLLSSATASAVDSITVTNAATANPATVAITASGTDGNITLNLVSKGSGVLQCNGNTCVSAAAALTSNLPVFGGGAGAVSVGTRTGNTTLVATSTGAQTNTAIVSIDASGNHIASPCTVDSSGNLVCPGTLTSGNASSLTGYWELVGKTSGGIGMTVSDIAGTATLYVLPTAVSSGTFLKDNGSTTCPTLPVGAPAACEQLAWASPAGSGTVASSTVGQIGVYTAATTVTGNTGLTYATGVLSVGVAGTQGELDLLGSASGTTKIVVPSSGGGTWTVQSGSDTFVGKATTDTLTNKSIAGSEINSGTVPAAQIPPDATVFGSGTITIPAGNHVIVGCTSTCTVPVPVPVAGYEICVKNTAGVTTVITLSALGSAAMYPKADDTGYGTAGTGTMVGSAAQNKVCLIGRDATHYELGAVNASANWTVN